MRLGVREIYFQFLVHVPIFWNRGGVIIRENRNYVITKGLTSFFSLLMGEDGGGVRGDGEEAAAG